MIETLDLFPNALGRVVYENAAETKETIVNMMENAEMESNAKDPSLYHFQNDTDKSFLHNEELKEFKEWMEKTCTEFVRGTLGYNIGEMIITDSWLNLCDKGGGQYPHFHGNAYISGTYYVNFKQGHAPLCFRHPENSTHSHFPTITLQSDKSNPNKYNSDVFIFPEEGELVMWQSNLTHGYTDNQLDGRISISMNFMPSVVANDKYSYRVVPLV
tara:strand:- start:1212 stop:1856 length:645 start_codon:yes stop_codon:yes gene_type:complete